MKLEEKKTILKYILKQSASTSRILQLEST